MAPPIKQLQADPGVVKELQRRSRSATISVRDRGRADIILLRLDGLGVEVVAQRLNTTPKRVSLWSRRFETCGLDGLVDKPVEAASRRSQPRRWRASSPRRRVRRRAGAAGAFAQ